MGIKLAVAIGTQAWHALAVEHDRFAGLGARFDIDFQRFTVEVFDGERGTEGGVDHRHTHAHVQVIGIAFKDRVLLGVHFDIQVTGWAAAVANLALVGHADAHAIADTSWDIDGDVAALLHTTIATTVVTRIGDDLTEALALRTGTGSHHVAKEGALHFLNFTRAATAGTGNWLSVRCRAGTRTTITQHRGINRDGLAHAGISFFQSNGGAQQRIIARLYARAWPAALATAPAEELSEDITQTAATEAATAEAASAGLLLHRVRAHIHYLTLLRIQ